MLHLILPSVVDIMEDSIRRSAIGIVLQFNQVCRELPDQVVEDNALSRVVAKIHVSLLSLLVFIEVLVFTLKLL